MTTATLDDIADVETMFHDLETVVADADYTETLEDFQQTLAEQHAGMFAGEFDSNLNDWATLKPSTIKGKGHDRILVESGALMASLTSIGGPGNIHEVMPRGMLFGTEVEYAHFHVTGTKKMPARPPVGVSEESLDKLCDRIGDAAVVLVNSGGA